jgi:hypothetical protein
MYFSPPISTRTSTWVPINARAGIDASSDQGVALQIENLRTVHFRDSHVAQEHGPSRHTKGRISDSRNERASPLGICHEAHVADNAPQRVETS